MKKILSLLFITFTCAFPHPHTFIEIYPTLEIKNEKIQKLNIKWKIDEMTSSMLIMDVDSNANNKISKKESNYIYENYFSSLEKQNFYFDSKNIKKLKPKNFKASIHKNKLVYSFDILAKEKIENLKIDFLDKELFVGFIIEKKFIKIKGSNIKNLKEKIFGVN